METIHAVDTTGPRRVLVVDDESTIRHVLEQVLAEDRGCDVRAAGSAEEGLRLLAEFAPQVALVDIILPGLDGLEFLKRIKEISPTTEVLIMTSHASVETAVEAIRRGAYEYLQKPFEDLDDIWLRVRRALEKHHLTERNRTLLSEMQQQNRKLTTAVMRLTSLIDAGRAMAEFDSLPDLLSFFIGTVANELGVERASLMLLDPEGSLRIAAHRGIDTVEAETVRLELGEGVAGTVAQTGKALLVTDTGTDPRIEKELNPTLSRSFISAPVVLSIPIKAQQNVLGVINVTNRASGKQFDQDDLAFVEGLAGQVSVAIERTRHMEDLRKAYDSLMEAQDQLVRSERLKALGEMAAGVAHDFNNSLSVILGRAEFALRRHRENGTADPDMVIPELETIRNVSRQAAGTIRRIQDYTRIRKDAPETPVRLDDVVLEVVEMTRPKWKEESEAHGHDVAVVLELGGVDPVSGNPTELNQVVSNLVFNAVEAMPQGGRLTFRTFHEDDRVVLEVADTGVGMSESARKKVFEPFFTTKEAGQGLGLSIVFGIVSRHGGEISVDSEAGSGTVFRVRLPRAAGSRARVAEVPVVPEPAGRAARVLLVDDDTGVLDFFQDALRFGGHDVVAVGGGNEALARLSKETFDLLITDLSMAEMSGLEIARGAKRLHPALPVVLLSGWAVQQDSDEVREAGVDFVLGKPCEMDRLLATVQEALGGGVDDE